MLPYRLLKAHFLADQLAFSLALNVHHMLTTVEASYNSITLSGYKYQSMGGTETPSFRICHHFGLNERLLS